MVNSTTQRMKRILLTLLSFAWCSLHAQVPFPGKMETKKGQPIICPADYTDVNTYVPMPFSIEAALSNSSNARVAQTNRANFIVEYVDFPNNARAAFQKAVDIWAETLKSTVPIRVLALWQPLGRNVLGSATAGDFNRNFPGALKPFTWYPIALAEKLAGKDLNSPNEYDIVCRFSSEVNWFFGPNGLPGPNQFDLTSVVLHELCHGLGFVASMEVSGTQGQYGYGTTLPFVFDKFLENGEKQSLTDTSLFRNPSTQLRTQLTTNNLFFSAPLANSVNGNSPVKLFAPTVYSSGSSISHLDDATFGSGDVNSLMTSTAAIREVNLNPGPIVVNMFKDMGWASSSIVHENLGDFPAQPFVDVQVNILSDTTLVPGSAKLFYTFTNNGSFTELPLTFVSGNTYTARIPIPNNRAVVTYYFSVQDNFKKTVTSPPSAPNFIWQFEVGAADNASPEVITSAPDLVPAGSTLDASAIVIDNFEDGVASVTLNYQVNGTPQSPVAMRRFNPAVDDIRFSLGSQDRFQYIAPEVFKNLASGDRVRFQIVARDKTGNTTTVPTTYTSPSLNATPTPTFYEFIATDLKSGPQPAYITNFNDASTASDFALLGFTIGTAPGLSNGSLYTNGGYPNGLGALSPLDGGVAIPFSANQLALLRIPISLKSPADSAVMTFDEVVLVEPGETGAAFGSDEFWDYVVVEGSSNGGATWVPFADGYDSRADRTWLAEFNKFGSGDAPFSEGVPTPALYKPRSISLTGSNFASGEDVLIRFRLFSDQFVKGWGWTIDNLRIQSVAPKPTAVEPDPATILTLSPNPVQDVLRVQAPISDDSKNVILEILDAQGRRQGKRDVTPQNKTLDYSWNLSFLPTGNYLLRIQTNHGFKVKRFSIVR